MAILSIELFERNKCRLSQGGKTSHDDISCTLLNKILRTRKKYIFFHKI